MWAVGIILQNWISKEEEMGGNKGYLWADFAVFKLRLQRRLFGEHVMSQLLCGSSYLCYPQPEAFSVAAH